MEPMGKSIELLFFQGTGSPVRGDALPKSSSVGEVGLADGAVLTAVVAECQATGASE